MHAVHVPPAHSYGVQQVVPAPQAAFSSAHAAAHVPPVQRPLQHSPPVHAIPAVSHAHVPPGAQ
jgi:hypothetical protein